MNYEARTKEEPKMRMIAGKELLPYLKSAKVEAETRKIEVAVTKQGYTLVLDGAFNLFELEALAKMLRRISKANV